MYNINILPPKMRKKPKKKVNIKIGNPTYAPFLLLGVIVTCGVLNFQLDARIKNIEEDNSSMKTAIDSYNNEVMRVQGVANEVRMLKDEINRIKNPVVWEDANITPSVPMEDGFKWDLFLDEVAATTPAETTITAMNQPDPNQAAVIINFETYTLSNMARTKEAFEKSPYFENVQISNVVQNHTNLIARPLEVTFSLTVTFNSNPVLPVEESHTTDGEFDQNNEFNNNSNNQSAETDLNNSSGNGNQ